VTIYECHADISFSYWQWISIAVASSAAPHPLKLAHSPFQSLFDALCLNRGDWFQARPIITILSRIYPTAEPVAPFNGAGLRQAGSCLTFFCRPLACRALRVGVDPAAFDRARADYPPCACNWLHKTPRICDVSVVRARPPAPFACADYRTRDWSAARASPNRRSRYFARGPSQRSGSIVIPPSTHGAIPITFSHAAATAPQAARLTMDLAMTASKGHARA